MSVSVIVPTKNATAFLVEAITSVLAQGRDVGELIIVDDKSTDDSVSIARGFADSGIQVVANCGSGVSAARNTGARAASGEWLMFLDSDDRLRPGAIAALLRGAELKPHAIAIYGDYSRVDRKGRRLGIRHLLRRHAKPSGRVLGQLVSGNFIVNGGVMIVHAASFATAGGFDEALRYCEDWHCWCRLAALGEFRFIPDLLLDYRIHSANTMNAAMRSPQDFLPSAEHVFRDLAIVGQLPSHLVSSLRRAADVHLIAYAATQAVRFHEYKKARAYTAMAVRRSPAALPSVVLRIVSAFLGI